MESGRSALKEAFNGPHGADINHDNILGVLSLMLWALILVVSLKYVLFIMRADAEVVRWQNTKRQQRWRQRPENRKRQASLARIRRQKEKLEPKVPSLVVLNACSCLLTTATDSDAYASCPVSSRCSKLPESFCDRPGCYDATRDSQRNHAKYCGNDCRNAVDRAKDRQRKSIARASKYRFPVSNYGTYSSPSLSFPHHTRSDIHDRKTNSGSRPRPPPAN